MLNLDTVDVPIQGETASLSIQDHAEFLKEITKPVLQVTKTSGTAPCTAKVLFEDAEPEGNGITEPLDVLGGGRSRRGLSSAGFSAKERAAFIESMIASGNLRDRSKSDTGTYYSGQRKEEEEEEEEEADGSGDIEGRGRTTSNASNSYFNESHIKEVSTELDDAAKKLPPYLRFAAGREKRSVSDAAYSPTVVTTQPPARRQQPVIGREKRSVSDAAYMKWARKQLPVEEEDEEEYEDYEEEEDTGGEAAILEPQKQGRGCKALDITDPQTNQPIDLSKVARPNQMHHIVQEEPQPMTWDEFRYKEEHNMQQYPHHPQQQHQQQPPPPPPQFAPMPMAAYPGYGVPPAYTVPAVPFAGQPIYPPSMYPGAQQLMYVHRTPERYRWEQSLQKFVKTMDASVTYYPMPAPGMAAAPMGMAMQPPVPPPPPPALQVPIPNQPKNNMPLRDGGHSVQRGPNFHHQAHHQNHHQPQQQQHHHHHQQHHAHQMHPNHPQQRTQMREDSGNKHENGSRDNGANKKKDSRDPFSFSAFLTAKNVTIPGDDSGSRAVMMQFLNEYLSQVTPSYPKRHVRNAQRQLKMLQRRAQQDVEAAGGSGSETGGAEVEDSGSAIQAQSMYPGSIYGAAPTFTPVALTV